MSYIVTAREQMELLSPWAEPDLVYSHVAGTHEVTASIGDEVVGYLRWWPPQRLGGTHNWPVIAPYELEMIEVNPRFQRRGIGTGMFAYARYHVEPRLTHSMQMTPAGANWAARMGHTPEVYHHVPADLRGQGVWNGSA